MTWRESQAVYVRLGAFFLILSGGEEYIGVAFP
jgi:hypothetical protein